MAGETYQACDTYYLTARTELLEDVQLSCSSTTTTPSTNTVSETVPSM